MSNVLHDFRQNRQEGNCSIVTKLGAISFFVYWNKLFHLPRLWKIAIFIDMLNSVAIGPAAVGSDIFKICSDSLSTLLVAGDDSDVTTFLTSLAETN